MISGVRAFIKQDRKHHPFRITGEKPQQHDQHAGAQTENKLALGGQRAGYRVRGDEKGPEKQRPAQDMVQHRPAVRGAGKIGHPAENQDGNEKPGRYLPGGGAPDDQIKSPQQAGQGAGLTQAAVGGPPEEVAQGCDHTVHLIGVHGSGLGNGVHGAAHVFEPRCGQCAGKGDHDKCAAHHGRIEQIHTHPAENDLADADGHESGDGPHIPGCRTGQGHGQDDAGDNGRTVFQG